MPSSTQAADPVAIPSSDDIAKSLEKYFSQYKEGSFVFHTTTFYKEETDSFDNLPLLLQAKTTLWQTKDKAKISNEVVTHTKSKGAIVQLKQRYETIRLNDVLLHFEINPKGKLSRVFQNKISDNTYVADVPLPLIDGRTRYTGKNNIVDYIRLASPERIRFENLFESGSVHIKITVDSEFGIFSIIMDKSKSYFPVRLTEEKYSRHLGSEGRRLSEVPEAEGGPLAEISTDCKAIRLAQMSGRWYVAEFETKCIVRSAKSKKADHQRDYYRLTNVSFTSPPEEMFRPSVPIPDGTSVSVVGEEMIPYEWRNGRVVKAIGRETLFVPPDTDYRSDRSWFWPSLILGLVSLAGIAAFFTWRWYRLRETS